MHHNRKPLIGDRDPWTHLFINIEKEDIGMYKPHSLVNIAGTSFLHQHEITFLTGATHCRAHHVAKMLAAAVINGSYSYAQSIEVAKRDGDNNNDTNPNRVLWIDTVHSFYSVCAIVDDLKQNANISDENLRVMCLDDLGVFNERYETVLTEIINAIYDYKPALVIIDDLDHLAPDCGYNATDNFYLMIREMLDHTPTALLCIGYNLIGKNKCTAGSIGKSLFAVSNNIFRVFSRGTVNYIQRDKGITCDGQHEFAFNINEKNFPQEVIMTHDNATTQDHIIEAAAVQEVISTVINKDETVTPEQLINRLGKRHDSIKRIKRHQQLIVSAITSGILKRTDDGYYRLNGNSGNEKDNIDYFDYCIKKSLTTNTIPKLPTNSALDPLTLIKTSPLPN